MDDNRYLRYRNALRVLGFAATLGYILFLISELTGGFSGTSVELVTMISLFVVFLAGLFFLWRNEVLVGIIWMGWYALLWILVLTVWNAAGMTVLIGLPVFILGVLLFLFGWEERRHLKARKQQHLPT